MSRSRPPRAALLACALAGALALAGCGAGQIAQTADQVDNSAGATVQVGGVRVVDAKIAFPDEAEGAALYPAGGTAPLQMRIVNSAAEPDRLLSARSQAARSVEISGETTVPSGRVLLVEGEPPVPEPAGTRTPSTPTPTPTPAATPTAEAAAGERVAQVVLTGLAEDVRAGLSYDLVLVFERAGEVRLEVPVAYPDTEREPSTE